MNKYRVDGVSFGVHSGAVQLTDEQARARQHCLGEGDHGTYPVLAPIQFKRGEEFGFDGDVPKSILVTLISGDDGDEGGTPTGDDLTLAIQVAIEGLSDDEANYAKDGTPKVDVLCKAIGYKISKEDRDAAWEGMSEE